jgi:hypothetical protein
MTARDISTRRAMRATRRVTLSTRTTAMTIMPDLMRLHNSPLTGDRVAGPDEPGDALKRSVYIPLA